MSSIVKTVARLTTGFTLLYGIYLALYNHALPGGGSGGGILIALSLISLIVAFGTETTLQKLLKGWHTNKERSTDILFALSAALLGLVAAYFFHRFLYQDGSFASFVPGVAVDLLLKAGVACAVMVIVIALMSFSTGRQEKP